MKLKIAEDLSLPVDVVTQTIAVLAKRRAGKSYTMRRLVEQLVKAGQQVVLVDPKGDQWGIRSAADGKAPGLPLVILGGERADVPLESGAGEVVAKLVVEERVSCVLDLSLFRKHEVATFMTGFLENLYRLKAREVYRTPMMLVIDEADAVAPQKPQKGEERMLGAAEDIVRRGGQRGIGCVLVTQRSAVLNKNVLTQAQVLVAMRTIAPQDLAAMNAWIDVHGTEDEKRMLMASLPSLPVGDAWVWSPGWPTVDGIFRRVHVLPIETFDSGATPDHREKKRAEPKSVAEVDLEALKRQMSATIEKAKADDPRELRKQIADLKKEIAQKVSLPVGKETAPKTVEKFVLKDGQLARLEKIYERMLERADAYGEAMALLWEQQSYEAKALLNVLAMVAGEQKPFRPADVVPIRNNSTTRTPVHSPQWRRVAPAAAPSRPASLVSQSPNGDGEVQGKALAILNALAELELLRSLEPERVLVAALAGYGNTKSTGFVKALGTLSVGGYVHYPSPGTIAMTDAGRAVALFPDAPRSSEEIQARVLQLVGGKAGEILRPLIDAYPKAVDRTEVATLAGYTNIKSTGFVKAIGRLSTLGFVSYPSPGTIAAQPVLFLEER